MTNRDRPWVETNLIMNGAGFDAAQQRLARIWASKHRDCEDCGAPAYTPCRNKAAIRSVGFERAGRNWHPHTSRVDYDKLKQALIDRGYAK